MDIITLIKNYFSKKPQIKPKDSFEIYRTDSHKYQDFIGDHKLPDYWFDTETFFFYIVDYLKEPIGYFAFRIDKNEFIGKVQQVYITEPQRDRNFGTILVMFMENIAQQLNIKEMYVFDRCESFWEKMGYTKTENISQAVLNISYQEDDEKKDGFMSKSLLIPDFKERLNENG